MKIYIVTTGQYSDYGISKVFLNKENAEKYVELLHKLDDYDSDSACVSEFETSDESINFISIYIKSNYSMNLDGSDFIKSRYSDKVIRNSRTPRFYLGRNHYNSPEYDMIGVYVYDEYTDDQVKKMLQDKLSEFKSLMDNEGWTKDMINEQYYYESEE